MGLDRTMQKERREHEHQVEDLGRRFDEHLREQLDNYRESAGRAAAELRAEMQQTCYAMLDQVKQAREELARETPSLMTQAEESFRRNLERVQERTLATTSEEIRLRASQWKARAEMQMTTPDFEAVKD
jgi:exonuclease VII large subunit